MKNYWEFNIIIVTEYSDYPQRPLTKHKLRKENLMFQFFFNFYYFQVDLNLKCDGL